MTCLMLVGLELRGRLDSTFNSKNNYRYIYNDLCESRGHYCFRLFTYSIIY